jgi:hypothetical protein
VEETVESLAHLLQLALVLLEHLVLMVPGMGPSVKVAVGVLVV